jgi:hypothetical protein
MVGAFDLEHPAAFKTVLVPFGAAGADGQYRTIELPGNHQFQVRCSRKALERAKNQDRKTERQHLPQGHHSLTPRTGNRLCLIPIESAANCFQFLFVCVGTGRF